MSNNNAIIWKNFETKFRDSNYMARWFISGELQNFLGLSINKCKKLVAFRKTNNYIGNNKLYNGITGLIYPDSNLAKLVGDTPIDYDQFVSAMNKHFLKPTGMHSYLYYHIEVSKALKEFMDLVEPGRLTTRIDAFRLLYKYVKHNNLVVPEKSKENFCLVKLDKTLSNLLEKPLGTKMRFHELKTCLEAHFPVDQRKVKDGVYPQSDLKDVFLAETLEQMNKPAYIRTAILNEPNSENKINTRYLAQVTGSDTIGLRSRKVVNKNSPQVKEIQAILDKALDDKDEEILVNTNEQPKIETKSTNPETFQRANLTLTIKKLSKVDTNETVLEDKKVFDYSVDYNENKKIKLDDLFKPKDKQAECKPTIKTVVSPKPKTYKPYWALAASLAANTAIAYTTYVIYKKDYDFYSSIDISYLGDMLFCYCIPDIALPYYSLKTLWTAANVFIAASVKK